MGASNHCDGGCIPKDWKNRNEHVRPLWWLKQCADLVSDSQAHLYVMKQSWQRLPGLDNGTVSLANSSHTSHSTCSVDRSLETIRQELESIPFELFILHRAQLDSRLKVAGFVWEDGRKVETGNYIRKYHQSQAREKIQVNARFTSNITGRQWGQYFVAVEKIQVDVFNKSNRD